MKFSLQNIGLLTDIFDIFSNYCESIKICINSKGLHLQSTDNANVSIIDIKLNYTYFDTYNCDKETIIDFNLNDICKILKICKKTKSVTHFSLEDNILNINTVSNNLKKIFKINSIYSTSQELLDINSLVINNIFEIESELIKNIFDDFILFSNEITIKLSNMNLYFYINNDSIDTVYEYYIKNIESDNEEHLSIFSLDYLHKFKLIKRFETCNIRFSKNSPIFLSSPSNRDIEYNFILAPKIT
tara:strand:+ start:798 stop:1529 length:732 start_codon:yes stop_codon:yes gene_type:complete